METTETDRELWRHSFTPAVCQVLYTLETGLLARQTPSPPLEFENTETETVPLSLMEPEGGALFPRVTRSYSGDWCLAEAFNLWVGPLHSSSCLQAVSWEAVCKKWFLVNDTGPLPCSSLIGCLPWGLNFLPRKSSFFSSSDSQDRTWLAHLNQVYSPGPIGFVQRRGS